MKTTTSCPIAAAAPISRSIQCRVDTGQVETTRQQVFRRFEKLTP
jgi:hypothetical protein